LSDSARVAHVILLSLEISGGAALVSALLGLPLGAAMAIRRFPGRGTLILIANALLGLPPVVVGLGLYLLLSRMGPLGATGLLFTPSAMLIAQVLLAVPIVVALTHRAMEGVWQEFGDEMRMEGAGLLRSILTVLAIGRESVLTAVLAAFGRTISEVGAIIIVGGNIAGYTRTMTTSIVLETSEGNLEYALGLGATLILISLAVSAAGFLLTARTTQ
jgi:tungstate transport system permease protein